MSEWGYRWARGEDRLEDEVGWMMSGSRCGGGCGCY